MLRKVPKLNRQLIDVWLFVGVTDTDVVLRRNCLGVVEVGAKRADSLPLPVPTDI